MNIGHDSWQSYDIYFDVTTNSSVILNNIASFNNSTESAFVADVLPHTYIDAPYGIPEINVSIVTPKRSSRRFESTWNLSNVKISVLFHTNRYRIQQRCAVFPYLVPITWFDVHSLALYRQCGFLFGRFFSHRRIDAENTAHTPSEFARKDRANGGRSGVIAIQFTNKGRSGSAFLSTGNDSRPGEEDDPWKRN